MHRLQKNKSNRTITELRMFIRGLIEEQMEDKDIKDAYGLEICDEPTRKGWDGWDSHNGEENQNKHLRTGYDMAYNQPHDELQGLVKLPNLFNIDDEITEQ